MKAYLEYTHGIIRVYDQPIDTDAPCEGFYVVLNVTKIGPADALLSADLSSRKLTRADIKTVKQVLIDAGFKFAYAWRHTGRRVPYGGTVIKEDGHLALWRVEL